MFVLINEVMLIILKTTQSPLEDERVGRERIHDLENQ
jgi:hypothetical protein